MNRAPATAKLNLALVVGPLREDGRHEVATVLQRIDLADRVSIEPAAELRVEGFAEDTLVRAALERLAEAANSRAALARADLEARPRRGRPRRRQLRRRDRAQARQRDPRRAALAGAPARARGRARRRRPLLPHLRPAARHRHRHRARAAGAAAGLLGRPAAAARPAQAVDGRRLRRLRPPRRRSRLRGTARRACATRWPRPSARATWQRCRRTTSPPRRMRNGCSNSAPSAPTSAGPDRPSTGSSCTARRPPPPSASCGPSGAPGSPFPLGTVEHDGRQRIARAREPRSSTERRVSAAGCSTAGSGSRSGSRCSRASSSRSPTISPAGR